MIRLVGKTAPKDGIPHGACRSEKGDGPVEASSGWSGRCYMGKVAYIVPLTY